MKKLTKLIVLLSLLACPLACTNLELVPTVGANENVVFKDPAVYKGYLYKLYTSFTLTGQRQPAGESDLDGTIDEGFSSFVRAYWCHQVLSTDEAINSWSDPGIDHFQKHSWSDNNVFLKALYYRIYFISTFSNDLIKQSTDEKLDNNGIKGADRTNIIAYGAEARFLRALAYWIALDLFRNIPLITDIGLDAPKQVAPKVMFDFIESELKAIENDLPAAKTNVYGRADRACSQMLLSKLYLNAEVYIGESKYTEAMVEINKVLSSGYSLATKYDHLFYADNFKENGEIILPLPLDGSTAQTWGATTFLVSAALSDPTMQDNKRPDGTPFPKELLSLFGTGQAWSGNRPNEALVNRFKGSTIPADTSDPRGLFWKEGRLSAEIIDVKVFGTKKEGYLCTKWKNINQDGTAGSNVTFSDIDFPMFRLADVYLMYAECVLRGAGGDAGIALSYINSLRERAYGNSSGNITASDMTLDFILDERQREMYWEGTRRTDLIRFNKFTDNYVWAWKGGVKEGVSTPAFRSIFPIPSAEVVANRNIVQNPGY